jgi:hypothetical protein
MGLWLYEILPGGIEAGSVHLIEEGHNIEPGKGKKPSQVIDFEKSFQNL